MRRRSVEVELEDTPADGLERLAGLAEAWGASWRQDGIGGGHLAMPVRAGLRRGLVEGPVTVEKTRRGSRMRFEIADRFYRVQYSAFFLLLMGAIGGVVSMIAPFSPRLLPLMPVSIILAVAAWLLIVSRLHNSGPEEFFALLAAEAVDDGEVRDQAEE